MNMNTTAFDQLFNAERGLVRYSRHEVDYCLNLAEAFGNPATTSQNGPRTVGNFVLQLRAALELLDKGGKAWPDSAKLDKLRYYWYRTLRTVNSTTYLTAAGIIAMPGLRLPLSGYLGIADLELALHKWQRRLDTAQSRVAALKYHLERRKREEAREAREPLGRQLDIECSYCGHPLFTHHGSIICHNYREHPKAGSPAPAPRKSRALAPAQ
jgi:hypothetical protein